MKKLKKGDCIGIIAPAGFIKKDENLQESIQLLKSWGLHVKLGKNVFNKHHHFAGTDTERIADLQTFLNDDTIHAIWFARGGYGSIRIIDKIDFTKFKKKPKWVIGYSDFTVFHQAINNLGIETIHAFMPTSYTTFTEKNTAIENFKKVLFGESLTYQITANKYNRFGKIKAEIVGGNLAVMASLLGTEYTLQTKNKILFIEDVGEYKYRIDRMLYSLKLNGYFKNCSGLLVGSFTKIPKNNPNFGMSIEELILDIVKDYNFPVCFNFPAGHISNNNALIFGRNAELDISKNKVMLSFE